MYTYIKSSHCTLKIYFNEAEEKDTLVRILIKIFKTDSPYSITRMCECLEAACPK